MSDALRDLSPAVPLSPAAGAARSSIVIYRSELLAYSETFIAAQAAALRTFAPIFAGVRRLPRSLDLPVPSSVVAEGDSSSQRARRYAFLRLGHAPALIAHLRATNPAMLHAHFALDGAEALPLARALAIPMVVTLHGYDVMTDDQAHRRTRRGSLYLAQRKRLFHETSLFLCVSEAIRQKAIERGFPPEKLRVHAIGIDVARYQAVAQSHAERSPVVLFVGRLVEKKGCVHLVRAMGEVRRVVPEARLVVLGDGPERARLEAEAERWGAQAIFLGVQSGDQVRQWMAASRVLAVPSITACDGDAEGLPTVLFESMAMGLSVACSRTSGIPELVRHDLEGLLSEEKDEAALAGNLLRLCQDQALAVRLGRAGRQRVETSFDLGAQTAQLENIYADIIQAAASSKPASAPHLMSPVEQRGWQTAPGAPCPPSRLTALRTHLGRALEARRTLKPLLAIRGGGGTQEGPR